MFTKSALLSTLFVLPLFTVACGQPEEFAAEDLPEDAIASTQSSLCTDSGVPYLSAALHLGDVGGSVGATSPSASYGSSACSGRFVIEATTTAGKPNLMASATNPLGISQSSCSLGTVSMLVYGYNGTAWSQIGGEHTAKGVWTPSPFGGPGSCQIGVGIAVPNTFQKVRVAAKAAQGAVTGKVSAVVSAHY